MVVVEDQVRIRVHGDRALELQTIFVKFQSYGLGYDLCMIFAFTNKVTRELHEGSFAALPFNLTTYVGVEACGRYPSPNIKYLNMSQN